MRIITKNKNIFLLQKLKKIFSRALVLTNNDVPNASVGLSFVSAEEMRVLNKEHRNVDNVTDVLSFPMLDLKVGEKIVDKLDPVDLALGEVFLGDIVICKEKIFSQAKEFHHSRKKEMIYLALHSFLHLLGFDHMTKKDEKQMFDFAERILGYGREI